MPTRDSILTAIDRAHARHKKLMAQAKVELETEAFWKQMGNSEEFRLAQEAATRTLAKARRIVEVRLPKLGARLAEIDTMVLVEVDSLQAALDKFNAI